MSASEQEPISLVPPVVFLGDIHLSGDTRRSSRLAAFLMKMPADVTLVFAGDVVDFWLEGPHFDLGGEYPVLSHFCGRRCFFVKGNRDFLIGEKWESATGGTVLGDLAVFNVNGNIIRVLHGDVLVKADWRYQVWRRLVRTQVFRWASGLAGAARGKTMAKRLQMESEKEIARKAPGDMVIDRSEVEKHLESCNMVVCGHTHKPQRSTLASGELVVLGSWDRGAEVFCMTDNGSYFQSAEEISSHFRKVK